MPSLGQTPASGTRMSHPSSRMTRSTSHAEEPADDQNDLSMFEDTIDTATFEQILEMDDDETREFSRSLVWGYFEQAESTFRKMERAITGQDLQELSQLGHFLKGSSATLGLTKVKDACEKIQHFGSRRDESGTVEEPDDSASLANIKRTLIEVKGAYDEIVTLLKRYYGERPEYSRAA